MLLASPFRSKSQLEAENAALRHQLAVLRRKVRGRVQFSNDDRLILIQLYRWFPSILKAITIIRPETLVRWHRAGFRRYWRWKSRSLGGITARPSSSTLGGSVTKSIRTAFSVYTGSAATRCRPAGANPTDQRRQSAVGCAAHPWRTAQAWLRGRSVQRRQVHGQAA